jgi:lipopolysaccharide biosynthesis glycosyltransferase
LEELVETGHEEYLAQVHHVNLPKERLTRILSKSPVKTENPDRCIYYCADKNYLVPGLVSITSLAVNNATVARRAKFFLVMASEAVSDAVHAVRFLNKRLGLSIEVIDASTIVGDAASLRTKYGVVTGGQELSLAAYYRIFFARQIAASGEFGSCLYVDADTIIRGGLQELFDHDLTHPLMARPEVDRPEVRHAITLHGLKGAYFNSGILYMDMRNPLNLELLDRAIANALDPTIKLIFQDQCALNIAFDQCWAALPSKYNFYVPPNMCSLATAPSEAVVIHYLDRPKPWDSLYGGEAREWFSWYDFVKAGERDYSHSLIIDTPTLDAVTERGRKGTNRRTNGGTRHRVSARQAAGPPVH